MTGWDAVVVGAGLGGLTCAAQLAVGGQRVLVLEQFTVVGGNTHVFHRRRSYEFDVGIHYLGDCGPDGVIPAILAGAGVADQVGFKPMDPDGFDRIRLPGLELDMPVGWDGYRSRLRAALPGEAAGIDLFIDICAAVGREQRFALLAGSDVSPVEVAAATPTVRTWGRRTLDALFTHCGLSSRARTVLAAQSPNYGLAPGQASVAMHASVFDHYLRGAYYPAGGGQTISNALVTAIERNGGQVRLGVKVREIVVTDGAVRGVLLDDGTVIAAPTVVSNADYLRTVTELVGVEHFPPSIRNRARDAVMGLPWLVLYLGLDIDLRERRNANLWWYDTDDIDGYYRDARAGALDEIPFLFISFASLKDPEHRALCPPGHANLQVMTLCPPDPRYWGVPAGPACGVRYRREPGYQERKQRLTEATLRAAERALGPLRRHLTHLEAATPLTHERYTRSTDGTPFGLAEWGGTGRPDTATSVRGLHVVGASTRYGNGVAGVMVGGTMAAGHILGIPLLAQAHRRNTAAPVGVGSGD